MDKPDAPFKRSFSLPSPSFRPAWGFAIFLMVALLFGLPFYFRKPPCRQTLPVQAVTCTDAALGPPAFSSPALLLHSTQAWLKAMMGPDPRPSPPDEGRPPSYGESYNELSQYPE